MLKTLNSFKKSFNLFLFYFNKVTLDCSSLGNLGFTNVFRVRKLHRCQVDTARTRYTHNKYAQDIRRCCKRIKGRPNKHCVYATVPISAWVFLDRIVTHR